MRYHKANTAPTWVMLMMMCCWRQRHAGPLLVPVSSPETQAILATSLWSQSTNKPHQLDPNTQSSSYLSHNTNNPYHLWSQTTNNLHLLWSQNTGNSHQLWSSFDKILIKWSSNKTLCVVTLHTLWTCTTVHTLTHWKIIEIVLKGGSYIAQSFLYN